MQKIMVFVIIFCMVSFVIGSVGLKFIVGLFGGGANQLIATYGDGQKIKTPHFLQSQRELDVLQMLMADRLLMAQSSSGLSSPLLVHLLFPSSPFAAEIPTQLKQAIQRGQIPITQTELNDYFQQQSERPEIMWLLLKEEAFQSGCVISNQTAAQTLRIAVPQMTGNQLDAAGLVNQIITRTNVSEEEILTTLSNLMSISAYARNILDSQAVTINQIRATLGRSKERIDADFVKIEAPPLIDESSDVSEAQVQEQFDKYRAIAANNPTEENPFGFGYKLPKRIQLEYMIVSMDDIKTLIEKPAAEAIEEYYTRNIEQYQSSKPSDPNNPESAQIMETRPFAEVEGQIRRTLETEKTTSRANILFNEIKDKTESGFETLTFEEASVDELQKAAGDYVAIGTELSEKYNLDISVGKTGWLDAGTFADDKILSSMGVRRGQAYLRLSDAAFSAYETKPERRLIGVPIVRIWENIGPLNGSYYAEEDKQYSRLMALVRVVAVKDAAVPQDLSLTFNTNGAVLSGQTQAEESTFVLADKVKDDIRLLAAMEVAKTRAEELAGLITDQEWDKAITTYNDKYAKDEEPEQDEEATGSIKLENITQQLRISNADIEKAKRMMLDQPSLAQYFGRQVTTNMLTNQLYALLPEGDQTTGSIKEVLAFEPQAACYVVKEVVRQPATESDYLSGKAQTALQLNVAESTGLTLTHLGPENILKRMNYQPELDQEPEEQPDTSSDEGKDE